MPVLDTRTALTANGVEVGVEVEAGDVVEVVVVDAVPNSMCSFSRIGEESPQLGPQPAKPHEPVPESRMYWFWPVSPPT